VDGKREDDEAELLVMSSEDAITGRRKIARKHPRAAGLHSCLLLVSRGFHAQQREFGLDHNFGVGVIIGEPTDISAKKWTSIISTKD
jgi:hypothetical protein